MIKILFIPIFCLASSTMLVAMQPSSQKKRIVPIEDYPEGRCNINSYYNPNSSLITYRNQVVSPHKIKQGKISDCFFV